MSGLWTMTSRMKCDSTAVAMTSAVLLLGRLDLSGAIRNIMATSPAQSRVAAKLWEYGKKMYSAEVSGLVPAMMLILSAPVRSVTP